MLLATDAASEGIDLQLHCHRLVRIETPFSPARMEQRNGRIARPGQPAPAVLNPSLGERAHKLNRRAAPAQVESSALL